MARKRALHPTYQDRHKGNFQGKGQPLHQSEKLQSRNSISDKLLSDAHNKRQASGDNEIEIISEDDLPLEDTPEDGELSEIRSVYRVLKSYQ